MNSFLIILLFVTTVYARSFPRPEPEDPEDDYLPRPQSILHKRIIRPESYLTSRRLLRPPRRLPRMPITIREPPFSKVKDNMFPFLRSNVKELEKKVREEDNKLKSLSTGVNRVEKKVKEEDKKLQSVNSDVNALKNDIIEEDNKLNSLRSDIYELKRKVREEDNKILGLLRHQKQEDNWIKSLGTKVNDLDKKVEEEDKKISAVATHDKLQAKNVLKAFKSAVLNSDTRSASYFLDLGADINTPFRGNDMKGRTALHIAAEKGFISELKELLKRGAKINIEDDHGSSPLHYAAYNGQVVSARILLEHGANGKLKNQDGTTPYDDAIHTKHQGVADEILKHYPELNPSDQSEVTYFEDELENKVPLDEKPVPKIIIEPPHRINPGPFPHHKPVTPPHILIGKLPKYYKPGVKHFLKTNFDNMPIPSSPHHKIFPRLELELEPPRKANFDNMPIFPQIGEPPEHKFLPPIKIPRPPPHLEIGDFGNILNREIPYPGEIPYSERNFDNMPIPKILSQISREDDDILD